MKLKILLTCFLISNVCAFVYSQSLYFPPISGDNSGNIPLLAISSFDNELWGKLNDAFCGTLSIASDAINNAIAIYPNPSDGIFIIDGIRPEQSVRITLFDHLGRKAFESLSNEKTIATGQLSNGIYSAFITKGGKYYPVRNKVVIIQ